MMTIHDDNHNQMFQSNPINILISLLSVTNGVKKLGCPLVGHNILELETKVHPKVRNHGEGPY